MSTDANADSLTECRHGWALHEVRALFKLPFNALPFRAQSVHRADFDNNDVRVSTLLSIKTGRRPADCKYCPQSLRWNTGPEEDDLLPVAVIRAAARKAREAGSQRFCVAATWRRPGNAQIDRAGSARGRARRGLETCMTLGVRTADQAHRLKQGRLDYYNPNSAPRSGTTRRSSPRAPTPTGWKRWRTGARPASRSACEKLVNTSNRETKADRAVREARSCFSAAIAA